MKTLLVASSLLFVAVHVAAQPQPSAPWPMVAGGAQRRSVSLSPTNTSLPLLSMWSDSLPYGTSGPPVTGANGFVYAACSGAAGFQVARGTHVCAFDGERSGALVWSFATSSIVSAGVAVGADGRIFVGSWDSSVYCLNGSTGALLWSYATGGAIDASPAIDANGTVYVTSEDGKIYALSPQGRLLWNHTTGGPLMFSAALSNDEKLVVVGTAFESSLYGLHAANGTTKWQFLTGGAIQYAPAISSSGVAYFASSDNFVYAVDVASGALRWSYPSSIIVTAPAIGPNGLVFWGSGLNNVFALNATGSRIWTFAPPVTAGICGVWNGEAVLLVAQDSTVYVYASVQSNHALFALNGDTGAAKFTFFVNAESSCFSSFLGFGPGGSIILVNPVAASGLVAFQHTQYPCAPGASAGVMPGVTTFTVAGTRCTACPAGSFSDGLLAATLSCTLCAAGSASGSPGQPLCLPCFPGQFQPLRGQAFCSLCPVGTSSLVVGASSPASCAACGAGTFGLGVGQYQCFQCQPGTYNPTTSSTSAAACLQCPLGTFNPSFGQTSLSQCYGCPMGQYSATAGASFCSFCPVGTASSAVAATSADVCALCAPGFFNPSPGATTCLACPSGTRNPTIGSVSFAACLPCAAGTYNAATGLGGACFECPAGSNSSAGASTCSPCGFGYYQPLSGQPLCRACAAGLYTASAGSTSAAQCTAGAFASCPFGEQPVGILPPTGPQDCVPLTCLPPLLPPLPGAAGGCRGCEPGTSFAQLPNGSATCAACGAQDLCPGFSVRVGNDSIAALSSGSGGGTANASDQGLAANGAPSAAAAAAAASSSSAASTRTPPAVLAACAANSAPPSAALPPALSPAVVAVIAVAVIVIALAAFAAYLVGGCSDGSSSSSSASTMSAAAPSLTKPSQPAVVSSSSSSSSGGGGGGGEGQPPPCFEAAKASCRARLSAIDLQAIRPPTRAGDAVFFRPTPLGGLFTFAGLVVIVSLALILILRRAQDNVAAAQSLAVLSPSTLAGGLLAPAASAPLASGAWSGVRIRIFSPAGSNCTGLAPIPNSMGSANLAAGAWAISAVPDCGDGRAAIVLACPACVFSPSSTLFLALPYHCQSLAVDAAAVDATGALSLASIPAEATSATPSALLRNVSWTLAPILALQQDTVAGTSSRGLQLLPLAQATGYAAGSATTILPLAASVLISVALPLQGYFSQTTLSEKLSSLQLLSSIIGLAGILGASRVAFALFVKTKDTRIHATLSQIPAQALRLVSRRGVGSGAKAAAGGGGGSSLRPRGGGGADADALPVDAGGPGHQQGAGQWGQKRSTPPPMGEDDDALDSSSRTLVINNPLAMPPVPVSSSAS